MRLDDVFDDRQTKTRSTLFAGACFIDAVKPLENAGEIVRGNTGAGIGDRNLDVVVFGDSPDHYRARRTIEFYRIVQEIDQCLLKREAIPENLSAAYLFR